MCGIAGTVGARRPDPAALAAMAAAMIHRGPDGEGSYQDETCGLAFRRLAIIDLHPRSDQPLHLDALHLVFNGEIYNYRELRDELRGLGHRFVTEGDGEVLLHAWAQWGEAALDRLEGMYGMAVYDEGCRRLTIATDPFGEKPVYWAPDGDGLQFASDIRALLMVRPDLGAPRDDALAPYLGLGLMPPVDESFFAHIRRLPAAHLLRWEAGRATVRRYWTPQPVEVPADYDDAVAAVREALSDSVRLRLRSDVPVGTSLSGGVDSSAIVGLVGSEAPDHARHAFTARFPGFARDEWRYAEAVVRRAGIAHHHAIEPLGLALAADLPALIGAHEEPVGSSSVYAQYCVMRRAHEEGVTVLLDGQGADELFGGYGGIPGLAWCAHGPRAALGALARGAIAPRALALAAGSERLPRALAHRHRRRLVSPYVSAHIGEAAVRREPGHPPRRGRQRLEHELLRQAFVTSMPALLRYADRNSMAHSREVRLPFLDRRLAELALSMPPQHLYRDGVQKAVLRDAVRDLVPAEVLDRTDKVGYETPQARWLGEAPLREYAAEVLLDPVARARGLYDVAAVEADHQAGTWRDDRALWWALNLELWLRQPFSATA